MFLKDGFDVNVKSDNGETPVFVACQFGHKNIVELLFENGADVWVRDKKRNSGCLHAASKGGHVGVMKLLLEKGLDINSRDMNGNTPFLRTCMSGQSKAAKFWLQNGAKITDVDKNPPWYIACHR